MEIKFSIKLRGSACPAAATAAGLLSAHALQDINIRDDFIIGSAVCVRVVSCSTYNLFKIFIPSEQTGHNASMEAH
jgi:hypothetical protein